MLPAWVAAYVGVEFGERGRGPRFDCWGLAAQVWRQQFGLEVPSYADRYATTSDAAEIGALVRGELGPWLPVALDRAREGDAILIRMRGEPMHVGVIVAPGYFLHVQAGKNACVEDYTRPQWCRRVVGVYRHEALVFGEPVMVTIHNRSGRPLEIRRDGAVTRVVIGA